ncbi:hypothetical protein H2200_009646 [Cladophialophora chaetospira]|uniref:Lysine-specific metallo-endopeptidase domain-containing protein n=1 Tax=Cladophialophora chaetospira TaxID=386627 RepID=A0AA39CF28_9EURO|nr:hypothetical protein H2200_009646 [Cladophialophora chaetospira]
MLPSRLLNRIWLLVVSLVAMSTGSDAAEPQWASGMTPVQTQMVQRAFYDAMSVVRAVALTFDPACDVYFQRYFSDADATFVKHAFRALANVDLNAPTMNIAQAAALMTAPLTGAALPDKYSKLSISYGDHPLTPPHLGYFPHHCQTAGVRGYLTFSLTDPNYAFLSLCTWIFGAYLPLGFTLFPPNSLRGYPGTTCDGLGDHETDYMRNPGWTVLHELMHWAAFFNDVPDYAVKIRRNPQNIIQIDHYTGTNPPHGNEPFYAAQVKNLPSVDGYSLAINNADSYPCYATVRAWSVLCEGKFFGPSPSLEDYSRRTADWYRRNPPAPQQPPRRLARSEDTITDTVPEDGFDCAYDEEGDLIVCD